MLRHSLVVVVVLTSHALAQPGATPPSEPPQPLQEQPAPPPTDEPPQRQPLPSPEERMRTPEGALAEIFDPDGFFEELATKSPELQAIARGTLRRARRKVAFGPTGGLAAGAYSDSQAADLAMSFGLGIELFKVPVMPSMENLKAIAKERAKAKLKQILLDELRGKDADPLEIRRMAFQIWTEALREVLGMENVRAKRLEKPSLAVGIEAFHALDAEAWGGRLRLSTGVWKLSVGLTTGFAITEPRASVVLGPEIALPIQVSRGPRSPVLNVYMRWDHEVREREAGTSNHFASVGARLLLDLI